MFISLYSVVSAMGSAADVFHDHGAPGYYEHLITLGLSEDRIQKEDADLLRRYINHLQATRGISPLRATKIAQIMISWRRFFPVSWRDATIDDIFDARNALETAESKKGKPYSKNTKNDHIRILKSFYAWMIKRKFSGIDREDLRELRAPGADTNTTAPEDLLTLDEITRMIEACKTHRDKAIIAVLYESGARIGELARMKWGGVRFDEYGVKVSVPDTKEDQTRFARLLMSTEYLAAWRNGYYGATPAGDALVFVSTDGQPLKYRAIAQVITRAGERAGIKKRIHPHLHRKSRITELVRRNYQESVIKEAMWGNLDTAMFKTYVKLSEKDIDAEFLERAGIAKKEEKEENNHLPRQCKYCFAMNAPTSKYCHMCTRPLTGEAANAVDNIEGALTLLAGRDEAALRSIVRRLIAEETANPSKK